VDTRAAEASSCEVCGAIKPHGAPANWKEQHVIACYGGDDCFDLTGV
jgi:hypothetical protein